MPLMQCVRCSSRRVLIGPGYDRHQLTCLDCGHRWSGLGRQPGVRRRP
jgi:hypothetical protein